ncbi:hypothetical protein [Neolewinella agarilytica]|uniref:hypothetical protein n=1 Tax=Neolewinella agarilytica TaxID=478744 RepID=UPI00235202AD|nr:hypothetical protein [Neolewinella agarilytica]
MLPEEKLLAALRQKIETSLAWGPMEQWTNNDFEVLSDRIAEATTTTLSTTTLKRVWGRVAYASQPSTTTLDALAVFAGYEHWRAFRASQTEVTVAAPSIPRIASEDAPKPESSSGWKNYAWPLGIAAMLALTLLLYQSFAPASAPEESSLPAIIKPEDYHLSFRPVTTGVPNSVVFSYDAGKAPVDQVFLQQSWDERRREKLDRNGNVHTSIYYLPGYYRAKLVVGNQIVAERELYLRVEDWVAAVSREPVPVYLPIEDIRQNGQLAIAEKQLLDLGLDLQPEPPVTVLTNVGKTEGLWSNDFTFQTRLRHDYATGAAACQHARVLLLLKNDAIIIPLSAPGCVADLSLYAGGKSYDGRNTDLSPFGIIGDNWLDLSCTGKDGLLTFRVNGKRIFQVESEESPKEIIGIRYEFSGMGSVDELRFGNSSGKIWVEEF